MNVSLSRHTKVLQNLKRTLTTSIWDPKHIIYCLLNVRPNSTFCLYFVESTSLLKSFIWCRNLTTFMHLLKLKQFFFNSDLQFGSSAPQIIFDLSIFWKKNPLIFIDSALTYEKEKHEQFKMYSSLTVILREWIIKLALVSHAGIICRYTWDGWICWSVKFSRSSSVGKFDPPSIVTVTLR